MEKQTINQNTLMWLWQGKGQSKMLIAALALMQVLLSVLILLRVFALRSVIDHAVAGQQSMFLSAVVYMLFLMLSQILVRMLLRYVGELTRSGLENSLKERLFSMVLKKDYAAVSEKHSEEWMTRLTSDTVIVTEGMVSIVPGAAGLLVQLIGALAMLIAMDRRLGLLIFAVGLPVLLISWLLRKKLKALYKAIQDSDGRLRVFLQERISNMLVIRSFSQEERMQEQGREKMQEHRAARMERMKFFSLYHAGFAFAMNGLYALGVIYGGYGLLKGNVSYGTFAAMLQMILQMQTPMANLSNYMPKFYAMLASAERLMEAETLEEHKLCEAEDWNAISLEDAGFTYHNQAEDKQKTLSHLNLQLRKGEYVAFTGPSGCGKSTALKLLMCLYPLDCGKRQLYTAAGRKKEFHALPANLFAYVPQGNQLLSGSIREIISFGDTEKMKQDREIWAALEIACAADFVAALDKKLDSVLGERGQGLSEGQMQRIAIARAIFSKNPVLLLDEATSSLDEDTEAQLLQNLRHMTEKTVVIVTHRPAALSIVDKIIDFGSLEG